MAILRAVSKRALMMALLVVACVTKVRADDARLRVEAPSELTVGTRRTIPIYVTTNEQQATPPPVIVSAHAAGRALNVVKGRLLRTDAADPNASPLHFELPVVAANAGVAILKISVLTYDCDLRCAAVHQESTHQVLVRE